MTGIQLSRLASHRTAGAVLPNSLRARKAYLEYVVVLIALTVGASLKGSDEVPMMQSVEALKVASADSRAIGLGWHAFGEAAVQELSRFRSLEILSLQVPGSCVNEEDEISTRSLWEVVQSFKSLTSLIVAGIPVGELKRLISIKHLLKLHVVSYGGRAAVRFRQGWSHRDPIPQDYLDGLKCLADADHLIALDLPPPLDWDVYRIIGNLPNLQRFGVSGDTIVGSLSPHDLQDWLSAPSLRELLVGDTADWSPNLLNVVATQTSVEVLSLASPRNLYVSVNPPNSQDWYPKAKGRLGKDAYPQLRQLEIRSVLGSHWATGYSDREPIAREYLYGTSVVLPDGQVRHTGLRLLQNLESLRLVDSLNVRADLLFETCASLPMLRKLTLVSCPGVAVPDDFRHLVSCAALEELDLSGCRNLTDDCMRTIADIPGLTRLSINGCHRISAVGIGHLMRAKNLKALSWSGAPNADDAAALIIAKHLTALDELHLDDLRSPMGDVGRKAIAGRKGWRVLTLPNHQAPRPADATGEWTWNDANGHGWNDELTAILARESPGLERLRIGGNGVSCKGFEALSACGKLGKIELVGGMLNPDTARGLASIPSLHWLAADLPRAYTMRNDPPEAVKSRTEAREAIAKVIIGVRGERGLLLTGK